MGNNINNAIVSVVSPFFMPAKYTNNIEYTKFIDKKLVNKIVYSKFKDKKWVNKVEINVINVVFLENKTVL